MDCGGLITESGNRIITEAGDWIVTECFTPDGVSGLGRSFKRIRRPDQDEEEILIFAIEID